MLAAALALRNAIDDARIDFDGILLGSFAPLATRLSDALRKRAALAARLPGGRAWN